MQLQQSFRAGEGIEEDELGKVILDTLEGMNKRGRCTIELQ